MIEKYDAFISYKHAPLDNRVADAIQKGLERYVLPKKVKEATGKQKIERIFRDKAELPITSNLDDNISYALENADFLIVICSKSTKLSTWVPREIEYFLQFHPISHVLTVLAEGEPGEVIPEILLKRKVLLTDAQGEPILDGQGRQQYVEKMMEPLSCDYRLPPAKAKKEELPRLAAAIAGCSYDELIMRARQYRMQRLAILGSAAAVLMTIAAAYLLWSRAEIQKNYNISQENLRQAQINQSVYLSHASETMFEIEHDGIGAAQLALAALGTQGEERPLVPQAIRALSQSIHAYTPEGLSTGRFPDGKYGAGSILLDFAVEKESGMIFLLDESGTASVFDISGQNCVYSRKFDDAYIERMFLLPAGNGKMVVCDGFSVFLLDWKQGKEMWRKDLWKNEAGEISDPEMAGAYKRNMANSYGLVSPDTFIPVAASLSPDGTMLAVDGMDDRIEIIDMVSGDTVRVFSADLLTMKSEPVSAWQKILRSEDQKYIAAAYLDEIADSEEIVLAVFETENGEALLFRTGAPRFEDYCFSEDNSICIITGSEIWEGSSLMAVRGLEGLGANLVPSVSRASCYSIAQGSLLWETDLPWHAPWENRGQIRAIDYQSGTMEAPVPTIGCAVSNMAWLLDAKDGEILCSNEFTDPVISIMDYTEMMLILKNGDGAYLRYEGVDNPDAAHTQQPHFISTSTPYKLKKVIYSKNDEGPAYFCLSENGTAVIRFRGVYDRGGIVCGEEGLSDLPEKMWKCGQYEILLANTEEMQFLCYDTGSKDLLWTISPESRYFRRAFEVKTEEKPLFCACAYDDDENDCCLLIDPADGSYEVIPLSGSFTEAVGDRLYRVEKDTSTVVVFSLSERTETRIPLKVQAEDAADLTPGSKMLVSPDGTRGAAASLDDLTLLMIDLQSGEVSPIQESIRTKNYFEWSEDGSRYALGTNTAVFVYTADGEMVCEIPAEGGFPSGIFFEGEELFVLYNTGDLFRYDLSDASETGAAKLGIDAGDAINYELLADGDDLCLQPTGGAGWLAIIDRESMELENMIESAIGYFPETGAVLTGTWNRSTRQYIVTAFEHYSADQLREKAEAFIGGNEIRPEMREQYGLSGESLPQR